MPRTTPTLAVLTACALIASIAAARADEDDSTKRKLTLERLFPEKGLFGPSARQMAFSHDGRHAAYLYRPYVERRHGSDLWIYDVTAGTASRVTSVSVMAEFQDDTRDVRDHRVEKLEKRRKEQRSQRRSGDDKKVVDEGGVTGTWAVTLTDGEAIGLTGNVEAELELRRYEDDSLGGGLAWVLGRMDIVEGTYDPADGSVACTLRTPGVDEATTLEATIDADRISGTLRLEDGEGTIAVDGRRQDDAADEGGDDRRQDDEDLGDTVTKDDADDEDAPRYAGISGFVWSPIDDTLLFTSGGDIYRFEVDGGAITRLTRTSEGERDVQFLPDGSGYTYRRGNVIVRVHFGSHLVEELTPSLERGVEMSGYRLSPDGRRLVMLGTKGESIWSQGRTVNIVNYRDRFAQVRQVRRHVSDDPLPEREYFVYLYDLGDHLTEGGEPQKVYEHTQSGPRDILRVPEWSPDSSRVAWSVFEQSSGHVEIVEARFLSAEEAAAADAEAASAEDAEAVSEEDAEGEGDDDDGPATRPQESGEPASAKKQDEKGPRIEAGTVIYRFLHNGGPNTPSMIVPRYLPDSRRMVFLTELSGFRHLHVLDPTYEQLDQLTRGRYEVYPIEITKDHTQLFCTATKDDPAQQHVFRVDLDSGSFQRLSRVEGVYNNVAVSPSGSHVLANLVDFGRLRELVAFEARSEEVETITDSHPEAAHELTEPVPEYFTFENRHGQTLHGHMFKPPGWSSEDARPLLIYVYGGPLGTRKMITRGAFSAPSYFFAYYMAKKHGYVTCTVDPRGASGYGGLFEKSNYEQVGRPQVEDLVDTARWFVEHQGVDEQRVGLHGWSFGGFQTQMCLYTEPEVFACGIAGAGPTEWENYNSWYSTGTIGPSREGKPDLEAFSLLPLAKNLEAKLLLVHGMEDSNVLYQDTVRVYRELLKAGKETLVELFLDPTGGHGLGGDVKTLNRYRKYEAFLLRTLGRVESDDEPADETAESEASPRPPVPAHGIRW